MTTTNTMIKPVERRFVLLRVQEEYTLKVKCSLETMGKDCPAMEALSRIVDTCSFGSKKCENRKYQNISMGIKSPTIFELKKKEIQDLCKTCEHRVK